jgi:antagonist of KipI
VSLRVARPGLLTTVQDRGRYGWQQHGVVVGGAMDAWALRVANLLAGNAADAAALEATLIGPTLEFQTDHLFALAGADLGAALDGEPVPAFRPCAARAGSVLSFAGPRAGCRAYLAVAGGVDVPPVLGSRSTDLRAAIGGVEGRALARGDVVPVGAASAWARAWLEHLLSRERRAAQWGAGPSVQGRPAAGSLVRALRGLEHESFTEESRRALFECEFQVSARSDRMGYRLEGPRLALERPLELLSAPVVRGTLQVPPGGDPIVLMADGQTVGGYPRIAQVITVDLPILAQAVPGARVRFHEVPLAEAQSLWLSAERDLRQLAGAIRARLPRRE